MPQPAPPKSQRQTLRDQARERRMGLVARREALFEMVASGYAIETIAAQFGITPGAVRRAIDQSVAARRLDSPQHFVHLQIARLHKALRAAEAAVDRNDLRGVTGMVRIVAQFDKYHRPALAAPAAPPGLPAPTPAPLALTHGPRLGVEAPAAR
jgi:AraC-like DNA-binding protein